MILVAQDEACHSVARLATDNRLEAKAFAGALFVHPKAMAGSHKDGISNRLPFPSVVIGARAPSEADFQGALALARLWGSQCVDGGDLRSFPAIRAGDWAYGEYLLNWLWSAAQEDTCLAGVSCRC